MNPALTVGCSGMVGRCTTEYLGYKVSREPRRSGDWKSVVSDSVGERVFRAPGRKRDSEVRAPPKSGVSLNPRQLTDV